MKKKLLITLFIYTLCFGNIFAESIGYINMEVILREYKEVTKFQESLKKKAQAYQKNFEEKQKKLEKAKNKGKSDEEIQKLISKIEEELYPQKQEIITLEAAFKNRLIGEVTSTAKIIAKNYGVDVVLDKNAVLSGGFDLTQFTLNKLNE
ncbi:MAG: OmpH family outer membrane protein [bacterium]